MNDRFKFRVWNKPGNSYISAKDDADFVYLEEEGNITVGVYNGELEDMMYLKEEDLILEQCTGLKDKNGKLIYDGDIILSNLDYGGTYFLIVGDVRGYCYDAVAVEEYKQYLADGKETCGGLSSTAYHIITDHGPCEVVGNIHENPELLEDK